MKNKLLTNNKNFDKQKRDLLLGGKDGERLYLHDLSFKMPNGRKVRVSKTDELGVDIKDMVARHKGRYGLVALFSRPGYRLLDFPCGSGYAADFLKEFGIIYEGKDIDEATIEYAKKIYGDKKASFSVGDLHSPQLASSRYDIIGCIEGLEHIDKKYQKPLITVFYNSLKPGGTLIISSPQKESGVSGPSKLNPYHKWELTKDDFLNLLCRRFKTKNVELVSYKAVLSTGRLTTCLYGVCHKK